MSDFDYKRRPTIEVQVGNVIIGGNNPVRLQSMTSTSTMDTSGSVTQCKNIAIAGSDIVRLTAQGTREAENMGLIRKILRQDGYEIPLVADIHFNPRAAFAAAEKVEKVRINPGNFVDPGRTFKKIDYTDEEYQHELIRLHNAFVPFLDLCKQHNTAIRIGVNHGSLSDRIMSRYGDTPDGMVESAMEFLRVCVEQNFYNVVISIKSSNLVVMVETVRRLVDVMNREGMSFPLHLGVTEAGDGEDGRIKSAIGIGTLLADGIGDTFRVSLTEDPVNELPVAAMIYDYVKSFAHSPVIEGNIAKGYDRLAPSRRKSDQPNSLSIGGDNDTAVVGLDISEKDTIAATKSQNIIIVESEGQNPSGHALAQLHNLLAHSDNRPAIVKFTYHDDNPEKIAIAAAIDFGRVLLAGFQDGIWLDAPALSSQERVKLCLNILQAARCRISKTEYIACPGCGRTLFNLQHTLSEVRKATSHLSKLKIGVMGCIVNGPGEMADADYGYVGASAGHISLYKGKQCVEKNIPQDEAIEHLIELIKANGDWVNPN